MECLNGRRTELPVCSFHGSLVPHIYELKVFLRSTCPWMLFCGPSWSRARWPLARCPLVQLSYSPGFWELFLPLWIILVVRVSGMTFPRAVSWKGDHALGMWECPVGSWVGKEEAGMSSVKSLQCGVPR